MTDAESHDETLLTVDQVADRLSLSSRTVRRLINDHVLVGLKIGGSVRVPPIALDMLIERATQAQTAQDRHPLLDAQRTEGS